MVDAYNTAIDYYKKELRGILPKGGITGMSLEGIGAFKKLIVTYCDEVQKVVDGFDPTADISGALKGSIEDAATEYFGAIKKLLQAYVSTMRIQLDDVERALIKFTNASGEIAGRVRSSADEIRAEAERVKLD